MNNLRQHYFESRANLPAKIRSVLAVLAIAVPALGAVLPAQASTFTVGGSGNNFTITRLGDTSAAETVHYRTVPLSAFPGQHYTEKGGTLVFAPGQTGTNIVVATRTPSADAYRFQTGSASRSYRFELTDRAGALLASKDGSVSSGLTQVSQNYVSSNITDLVKFNGSSLTSGMGSSKYYDVSYSPSSNGNHVMTDGYIKIDDGYDYDNHTLCTIPTSAFFTQTKGSQDYFDSLGCKLYATVYFTMKEVDDGYQYIQILADNATSKDGKDPDGGVNTPSTSIYKACFELSKGSGNYPGTVTTDHYQAFPHRTDNHTSSTEFDYADAYLYAQSFKDNTPSYRAAKSGSLVLSPKVNAVNVRFDANGGGDDTWLVKNLKVRFALCDSTRPTKLADPVVAPGPYRYGTTFYISIPFSEIVTVSGTPTLHTDWGDLSYFSGSGSNVLTFKGTINAAIGTQLYLSTLSGTVTDLAGNAISIPLTINKSFPATVDYPWPGAGTAVDPYVITTTNQLGFLASCVNATYGDIDFAGKFFELGADISYDYQYDWDNIVTKTYTITCETEDNYTAIGGYGRPFKGTFDGRGHTISGVRITKPGSDNYSTCQGLFGYVGDSGTVKNIFLRDAMIYGYNNIGGIAGYNRGVIMGCTVYHVRVFTGQDVTSDFNGKGPITGYNGGTVTGSHYRDCATLKSDGFCYNSYYSDLVTLSTASDVAAEPATVETATIDGTLYYATGNTFSLSCSIPVPENWSVVYTATGGATVNDATLTLASDDTIVSAAVVPPDDYAAHWQAGSGHDGTSAKPYLITTPDGLQLLSSEVNHGTAFAGTYFQLGNDIDMGAVANFMPIGNEFFPFSGTFDGNGHTISGISISRPNTNYQGLFGFLYNATVMNLTLADSSIEGGESIGGIAGNFDYGSIQNCFVTGTTLSGGNFIGAIAGSCDYDTLSGNAYHGCAAVINGSTSTCNIGIGNTGDSPTRAWPCCTLAFAEGIAPVTAPQFSFPVYGTNNSYYAAGQTVIVRAAAGGYAFANVRVNGIDATDNGDGTFSFTMPAVDATVTADLEALPAIPYIDADGEPKVCADYTVITNAAGNVAYGERGAEAWYVVTNDVTISGRLYFDDDYAHLIICDGATLAVTNEDGIAINSRGLIIYGQANGTGAIVATGISKALYSFYFSGIKSYFVIINSGSVTATGSDYGIYTDISVTINGGSVTATGGGYGIYVRSNITLGWTNPTDSIYANSYYVDNGKVRVKDDQRLTDGNAIYESGPSLDLSDLAGKTLVPAYSITLPAGVVASGVVTQDGTTAYALPGATVTLRAAAPGYVIGNVTVNGDTLEPVDGVYTFTASADGITVTAATVMTQWQALQTQLDAGGAVTLTNDVTAMSIDETLTVTNAVTLDLNGHTIDAASLFGAIRVAAGGHLTLTNSVPESGAITGGYSSDNGGGVCVDCGTFTMNGGAISGNAADSGGGGVYVGERGEFTMSGGEISGNSAAGDGGGVYMYYCNVSVLGSPVVFGNTNSVGAASNLYMDSWREIAVRGLSAGAYIGVTTKTAPTESSPVTFATGAAEGDETYFTSDNPGFAVYGEDGSLRLRLVVTYTVRFDANGGAGAMPDQTFIYDAQQALASNAFTRTGYTFAGWRGGDGSIYPDGATVSNLTVRHASLPADAWKLFDRMPYPGKTNDDYLPGDGALQNTDGDNGLNLYTGFENSAWNPDEPATAALISQNAAWFDEYDARNGVSMKLIEDFPNFYKKPVVVAQNGVVTLTAIWQPHVPVPYIDADGNEQMCTIYNVLTNANGDVAYGELGAENWYVVTNDVTISGRLFFGDYHAHLIVCDGATLTVSNENGNAIDAYGLAIHCQTNATGALVANGSDSGIDGDSVTINGGSDTATGGVNGICAYAVTINGGNVNATGGTYGIYPLYDLTINGGNVNATGGTYGIYACRGDITINGGNVSAIGGEQGGGIYIDNDTIILGWTNPTDSITASSYSAPRVSVKTGQQLTDGTTIYEDEISDLSAIAGATLRPAVNVITTRAELAAITNDLAGTYVLGADIDLAGEPWTPIGNNFHKFTGSLDGCGHVISNLTVTADSSNYVGLFGYLGSSGTDARVANLRIANATVSGRSYVGTLAGCAEDATVTNCSVVGATVMATGGPNYGRAGGLIGHIKINCFVSRCFAIADVSAGSHHVGGFIGVIDDDNHAPCVVSNCFSVGSVSSTANCVGGFIGYVTGGHGSGSFVFDCYTVARAHGSDSVGGFFGKLEQNCKVTLVRCYAAGGDGDTTGNSHVGGFAGTLSGSANFCDCFRLVDGLADVGSEEMGGGYNGTIVALDAAEMRSTNNFTAFQAAGCWTQTDGQTQPYFDWGLVDGKFLLLAGDTATATVNGLGAYAPGTDVPISINHPTDSIFLGWTGGATYANASANETTVLLDNYHVVSVTLGTRITTRAQLAAISSNLSGAYGLAADIDLSGSSWTPIGSSGSPFTGKLYGHGHKITGLTFDNTSDSAGTQVGLFGYIDGATIDGVHLEGVSIKGYACCGALAGEVHGASTIRNCSAQGSVSGNYSYIGLLAGYISGPGVLFEGCATTGTVSAAGSYAGGFAGIARGGSVTFTGCHACADVTSVGANDSRGGFISAIFDIGSFTFTRCTAEGTVSVCKDEHDYQNSNLGGFIGYVDRRCRGTFTDCSANVSVSAGYRKAGGFVGYIRDGSDGSSFLRCTAAGDVSVTDAFAGGFVGSNEGNASFTDCRADGHVDGNGYVGGFVGNVSAPLVISNCVARGDVRSSGDNYGGFAGTLTNAAAVVSDSWCSGAVWGTGETIGSFVGNSGDTANGTIRNCSISAYGAGPRPFCGSNGSVTGGSLSVHQVEELSKDGNGTPWPEVKQRAQGATKIQTVEDLFAVTNNLAGIYVLDRDIDLGGATWTPFGSFTGEFYGQNHRITNFVVNAAYGHAGFFGRIAGGRVSGVVLEGTVTGATDVGVGGFAGAVDSKSLVDGCSFQGTVANAITCNAGGFVGSVSDSPLILRCCVPRATVAANISGQSDSYAGGFVASLNGGYVMDCYAIADVQADGSYVGGFAGFVDGSIANAYCVGSVTSSGSYHGAFAGGSGDSGKITNSYYDYNKAGLGAVNNTGYTGVTGLSSQQMYHAANFAFDFDDVWKIDEGETTPYLRTFFAQLPEPELTGFQRFLVKYGLDVDTDPLYVTNGIPLIARYVYGIEPLTAQTDVNGHPIIDFKMDANGTPVFELAPQKNPDECGLRFTILASPTLSPWITIDEYPFDSATDLCLPDIGTPAPSCMFFKWRLSVKQEGAGE